MKTASGMAPAARPSVETGAHEIARRRRQAAELYARGLSAKRVAQLLDCDRKTVASDLRALGVEVRGRDKPDEERRQRVAQLYQEFRSIPKVAKVLGCSTTSVWSDLKALGIPRMDYRESLALADAEIQRQVDERRGRVAQLYPELRSVYKVAAELACSKGTIVNDLQALGLSPGPRTKKSGRMVACRQCGKEFWRYDCELVDGKYGEFCSREHWNAYRWKHGIAISTNLVSLCGRFVTAKTKRHWKGMWAGRKPPGPGARPRGYPRKELSDEQIAKIHELQDRKYGRATIARITGLSERQVRKVLTSA